MKQPPLGPVLTTPRLVEPIWGGTRLAPWLDLPHPYPERLGESWQVFEGNLVNSEPYAGRSLADLVALYEGDLVGSRTLQRYGADFPLLAKFIDANDRLSIQVHPDDAYAHTYEAHTGFHGKTEAWYIIDAAPGATVTYGLKKPCTRQEFAAAVADGSVEDLMAHVPVTPGDVIFVPAGTIHAINAGILLFEIQQKSDLTYRVYDYGRRDAHTGQPRTLHLEQALQVSQFAPAPDALVPPLSLAPTRDLLIACPSFALERWNLAQPVTASTDQGSFAILTVLDGCVQLVTDTHPLTLARGRSVVLPATLGTYQLVPQGKAVVLNAYVPDLPQLMQQATTAGYTTAQLADTLRQLP